MGAARSRECHQQAMGGREGGGHSCAGISLHACGSSGAPDGSPWPGSRRRNTGAIKTSLDETACQRLPMSCTWPSLDQVNMVTKRTAQHDSSVYSMLGWVRSVLLRTSVTAENSIAILPLWLLQEGSGQTVKRWLPFSSGMRDCVGQNLARMNYTTTVAMLLARFSFRLQDKVSAVPTQASLRATR